MAQGPLIIDFRDLNCQGVYFWRPNLFFINPLADGARGEKTIKALSGLQISEILKCYYKTCLEIFSLSNFIFINPFDGYFSQ